MDIRYKVEKISIGENSNWRQNDNKLNEIVSNINDGAYADDGWMLVSITPVQAYNAYTSHLVLLFKRI